MLGLDKTLVSLTILQMKKDMEQFQADESEYKNEKGVFYFINFKCIIFFFDKICKFQTLPYQLFGELQKY